MIAIESTAHAVERPIEAGALAIRSSVLPLPLRVALTTVAGAIVAGWLALVALHVDDDYRVAHTQGVWIAAAESAREGRLYPPLFDGGHYAGTRYMPLPILLNAAASSATGDPLRGGKLAAALLMGTLLVLVVVVFRTSSCAWPIAAALAAVVVATDAGLQAGTTIGGDVLPAVLQLAALGLALRGRTTRLMVASGALAGLAFTSKLTGLWAACAIVTWLALQRQWRSAVTYALACIGAAAVVLGIVETVTRGGLSNHLLTFSLAGVHGAESFLRAPNQLLYQLRGHAIGTVVLLPLAALGAMLPAGWRAVSVIHIALGYALLLLLIVYADVGTGFNQLLDVVVLTAIAAGHLAGRGGSGLDAGARRILVLAVAVASLWAAGLDLVRTVAFDVRRDTAARLAGAPATRATERIARLISAEQKVLTEDPAIDVVLGRRPVVMDPFMVNRLDRIDPGTVDPLVHWIAKGHFDRVVLVVPLEDRSRDFWWADYQFGSRVAGALRRSYRPDGKVGRYYIYRPQ